MTEIERAANEMEQDYERLGESMGRLLTLLRSGNGGDGGGGSFSPSFAWLADPPGSVATTGTMGWAFTVSRSLVATRARVYSSSSSSTSRDAAIWRVSDETVIGETVFAWTTTAVGWHERDFISPVALEPGETYILVTWRANATVARLFGQDVGATPLSLIPEVTFLEGRETTTQNNAEMPTTVTDIVRAVDMYLELPS